MCIFVDIETMRDPLPYLSSRRPLFWDVRAGDIATVLKDSDEWVVPRVFHYGELEDIEAVIRLYGPARTREILLHAKLSRVAEAMAFLFLDIDKDLRYAS